MGFVIFDVLQALIFAWPLWLALILVQGLMIWTGGEVRWLPSALLAVGLVYMLARPLWH